MEEGIVEATLGISLANKDKHSPGGRATGGRRAMAELSLFALLSLEEAHTPRDCVRTCRSLPLTALDGIVGDG